MNQTTACRSKEALITLEELNAMNNEETLAFLYFIADYKNLNYEKTQKAVEGEAEGKDGK